MDEHMKSVVERNLAAAVEQTIADVQAGRITQEQGQERMKALNKEAASILVNPPKVETTTKSDDPRKGEPVNKPALVLYAEGLKRDGMSEKEILSLVMAAQEAGPEAIAEAATAEQAAQQAEADAKATAKYEASPAGIIEFAEAKRATDAAHEAKLADGRTVLEHKGFSSEDVSVLDDWEVLKYSGVDPEAGPERTGAMPASSMVKGA